MESAYVIVRVFAALLYAALVYVAASQPAPPVEEHAVGIVSISAHEAAPQ